MRHLLLYALAILSMADDCNGLKDGPGAVGYECYGNHTCDKNGICVVWKDQMGSEKSICAAPESLVVGGFLMPKACEECQKPQCPPPVVCPPPKPKTICPSPSPSPILQCTPCMPGWKRGK